MGTECIVIYSFFLLFLLKWLLINIIALQIAAEHLQKRLGVLLKENLLSKMH